MLGLPRKIALLTLPLFITTLLSHAINAEEQQKIEVDGKVSGPVEGYFEGYIKGDFKGELNGSITTQERDNADTNTDAGSGTAAPKSPATVPEKRNLLRNKYEKPTRFAIGVGPSITRFDSNVEVLDKESGLSIFIDTEGTLGLPEFDSTPLYYGAFRFGDKHGLSFQYMSIKRSVTFFDIDTEIEDIHVEGTVKLADESDFYTMNYSYAFYEDNRSFILAAFGLSVIDFNFLFDAHGKIELDQFSNIDSSYTESVKQMAPLPLLGADFWWSYSEKWGLGTRISLTGGSFNGISGTVAETSIRARYKMNKLLGFVFGINSFNAGIDIDEDERFSRVNYAMTGANIGLDFRF